MESFATLRSSIFPQPCGGRDPPGIEFVTCRNGLELSSYSSHPKAGLTFICLPPLILRNLP